ncbi:3'-5' exoribonuclease [Amphibacillus marinus]|uniref:3'-5' exoribonuclease n=1 Tax=Amphibacillus marinus TaxID=872970 RepID=A0A1H8RTE3_9BACI|nr:HD domain-containing protein [Amphibacillus marinus]SEO69630.1 3'-5' exoribonuclease [Amphibacillus marinus]
MSNDLSYFYELIPLHIRLTDEERQTILTQFPSPKLPEGNTLFTLDNEEAGSKISQRLLVNDFEVRLTRTQKQFLKLSFSNNSGMIDGKMWDNNGALEKNIPLLESNAIFDVEGVIDSYNGNKSIVVNQLIPVKDQLEPFSLLPYTDESFADLTIELISYLNELDEPFRKLAKETVHYFWDDFRLVPAAKGYHHNYLGGLLKHTVGLMRFARYILSFEKGHIEALLTLVQKVEKMYKAELYTQYRQGQDSKKRMIWNETIDHLYKMIQGAMTYSDQNPNYNLLIVAILYHDIGKILEYDHAGKSFKAFNFLYPTANKDALLTRNQAGIGMDPLGVLVGHIPYGVILLTKLIEQFDISLSIEDIHQLNHCILCHHGLPEWGSAVRHPQTLEGYLIHIVDYLDSRYENADK